MSMAAELFSFDRLERAITTKTLRDVMREAAAGCEADERVTVRPPNPRCK